MKIEFVNHSSFLVETGNVRLICDPWIEGIAFNKGWALLSPTAFQYDDFHDITHLWISHEHPDHFSTVSLSNIPDIYRRNITVFYQTTLDKKVVNFCRKLGFGHVQELVSDRWETIADDVDVLCAPHGYGDSWLCIKTSQASVLNVNDCDINSYEVAREVQKKVGTVDVLATQFSFASWEGNVEDVTRRRERAQETLNRIQMRTEVFAPRYVLPFASFVWFCHEENFYMNRDVNRIDDVTSFLRANTQAEPIVLYPGDTWVVGTSHSSDVAIEKYSKDYTSLESRPLQTSTYVSPAQLGKASQQFCHTLLEKSNRFLLQMHLLQEQHRSVLQTARRTSPVSLQHFLLSLVRQRLEPAYIYLADHQQSYTFIWDVGLHTSDRKREDCDVVMYSDSLLYCFEFVWGGESLQINGRFQEMYSGGKASLFEYFWLARDLNFGRVLTWRFFVWHVVRKLTQIVNRFWGGDRFWG